MTQDELKQAVGQAALKYITPGSIVGVGTGSTVNHFITALGSMKDDIEAAVSSSEASTARLQELGIQVLDLNDVDELDVYVDGADEINEQMEMIKGGGAALTGRKLLPPWPSASSASWMKASWYLCWAGFPCRWK